MPRADARGFLPLLPPPADPLPLPAGVRGIGPSVLDLLQVVPAAEDDEIWISVETVGDLRIGAEVILNPKTDFLVGVNIRCVGGPRSEIT